MYKIINGGFHSYKNDYTQIFKMRTKCVIPKGTPYYENNEYKEYVSLKIKFVKILGYEKDRRS